MHGDSHPPRAEERIIKQVVTDADARDKHAERRDRAADGRDDVADERVGADAPASTDRGLAAIDRVHAGRDRDAAAVDRAALIERALRQSAASPEDEKPRDDA